jgi:hypothetical protein
MLMLRGVDRHQRLDRSAAQLLNLLGIPVKHFQDRERLTLRREQSGHLPSRQHGHRGMITDIVLSPEGFRIGQCRSGDQGAQVGFAALQFLDERRLQFVGGRRLQEVHQWIIGAKAQSFVHFAGERRREAEVCGQMGAQTDSQHSAADVGQELASRGGRHGQSSDI